jgi:hypothetical protein
MDGRRAQACAQRAAMHAQRTAVEDSAQLGSGFGWRAPPHERHAEAV